LVKLGSDRDLVPPSVFVEDWIVPSIKQPKTEAEVAPHQITQILTITPSWMQVFIDFFQRTEVAYR
jgi:hypothetical protein